MDIQTSSEFVSLISDTTFKYFMKNDITRKWLLEIINKKTGIDLFDYMLVDNESNTGNNVKDYRMDLVFKKEDNVVIVEMNGKNESQSLKGRYYLYRIAGSRFNSGEMYKNTNTKLIMFNNYRNSAFKNLNLANYRLNDRDNNLELEDIEIYEIYLPNYHKMCYDKCDEIEKRLWLFNCNSYEEMRKNKLSEEDKAIIDELERLSMDSDFIHNYDHDKVDEMLNRTILENETRKAREEARKEGLEEGRQEGIKEGIEEGRQEGIREGIEEGSQNKTISIAKNLLNLNISIEDISKSTGLSLEEIEHLKELD